MDLSLLYTTRDDGDRICKLCEANVDSDGHLYACPGIALDKLRFSIRVQGANCGRGCCGYTNETVEADTLESAIEQAASAGSECVRPSYDAHMIYELDDVSSQVQAVQLRKRAERKAKEAAEAEARRVAELAEAKRRGLAALELERPDLTPEAYERRKAAISAP